jgi:hypothetical protein
VLGVLFPPYLLFHIFDGMSRRTALNLDNKLENTGKCHDFIWKIFEKIKIKKFQITP